MGRAAVARAGRPLTLSVAFRQDFAELTLDIAFEAPTAGTTVLFGRSGCGKTTTLNAVAGLLHPAVCRIEIDGAVLADTATGLFIPPERRRIGVVFQDNRLFPHMTAEANLRYGLRRAPEGTIRFEDVVDLLGLAGLLARRPHTLSGGERQRVAIGRALLSQPRLLAMDEPLSNLDTERKAEILPYLANLRNALDLPILYVTHALDEVFRLADTLVLIDAGHVVETGPYSALLSRADLPIAQHDEAAAVLQARIVRHDPARQLTTLDAGGCKLLVPLQDAPPGTRVRARVPAREVILAAEAPRSISLHNVIQGTVHGVVEDRVRHAALVEVTIGDQGLLARITSDAVTGLALAPGRPVLALIKSMAIEVLPG
jgi:molybdate transport system ATP-binding protein